MNPDQTEEIAKALLDIQAVTLNPSNPFTWTSGLKAPIYTDNRLIMSHPATRTQIEQAMVETIKNEFSEAEVIAGTATAGIPHAAIVAHILNLPMIYVRSSAKGHGKQNAIEGEFKKGAKVLMVEDLISTGGSVIQAAEAVQEAGGEVVGCLAIFNYLMKQSEENFRQTSYPLITLTNYQILVDVATADPALIHERETLEQWYKDPIKWSEEH